jgi:hypothetical protein
VAGRRTARRCNSWAPRKSVSDRADVVLGPALHDGCPDGGVRRTSARRAGDHRPRFGTPAYRLGAPRS